MKQPQSLSLLELGFGGGKVWSFQISLSKVKGANGFCDVLKFVRRLLHRVRVLSQWLTTPLANHIIGAHHQ